MSSYFKFLFKKPEILLGKKLGFLWVAFFATTLLFSQEKDLGTEMVNIVKPYTPSLSDAFKIKEIPFLNDTTTSQKKSVQYQIFSVPVASTFTPAKGKAATVDKAKPITLYDNYATLGFGNFTTVLGELYSTFDISRTDNAGIFFQHNSAQGAIDEVLVDNNFFDTKLSGNYTSRQKDLFYRLEGGVTHQIFNWYGLHPSFTSAPLETLNNIDPQQTYLGFNAGGTIAIDESIFKGVSAQIHYLSDAFASSEIQLKAKPEFTFPFEDFNINLEGEIDYVNGSFDRNYVSEEGIVYSFLNAGVTPSLAFTDNDLSLSLGLTVQASLDTENSSTDVFLFPKINASYNIVDQLIAYGGVEGGLYQNSYRNFKDTNPFVSPTLLIVPTNNIYNAFLGMKGKLTNQVGYNLKGSYGREDNKALFQQNVFSGFSPTLENYQLGNSFGVLYDDVTTLEIFGELNVEVSKSFSLGIQGQFYNYTLENQAQAWNLPQLEASLFSNFSITEKLYGGISFFFVGEREDFQSFGNQQVTLDAFFDANANIGYKVNERLSVFAKGSNLLGTNYERWLNFPVFGTQALLGANYKFNW